MLSVQVTDWAAGPKPTQAPRPEAPADDSVVQIRVLATGLHQLVRMRAKGQHYSSATLPHVPGIDGTGIDVATGEPVYFTILGGGSTQGTFSEYVNVCRASVFPLPTDVDPVQAAALTNPVMSSWMALRKRVDLSAPWSCTIIGATTASGQLAVAVARQLGAQKVFGAARSEAGLEALALDGHVVLNADDPAATDFSAAASSTVVLDYLWGPWPRAYLEGTLSAGTPVTYVNIGSMAGNESPLPASVLRSRDVTFRGSGVGAWTGEELLAETPEMLKVLVGMKQDDKLVKKMYLKDVEEAWEIKGPRVVLVNDAEY